MGSLKILKPGLLTTLQYLGNQGLAFYAIPAGGAMDQVSARQANLIVGNEENTMLLECTVLPPQIEFLSDARIALTGADATWAINDQPVKLYSTLVINKGDLLRGKPIRRGVRAYIAIQAESDTHRMVSSGSNSLPEMILPYTGRRLQKGDVLGWTDRPTDLFFTELTLTSIIPDENTIQLVLYPGPEYDLLKDLSKDLLYKERFSISLDSNRMGLRLNGAQLHCEPEHLQQSVPVFPGLVQLPPGGQAILLMRDAQTMGGYPRIGYVAEEDLDRLSQVGVKGTISFLKKSDADLSKKIRVFSGI